MLWHSLKCSTNTKNKNAKVELLSGLGIKTPLRKIPFPQSSFVLEVLAS